jgi:hypothetical protein
MEPITARHSFNCGDLITVLAGLQNLSTISGRKIRLYQRLWLPAYYYDGATHPVTNDFGDNVCMNEAMFKMLKPLIESQDYIESFRVFNGEKVDFDFDKTRDSKQVPMPYGHIHSWYMACFPQMSADLSINWLKCSGKQKVVTNFGDLFIWDKIIVNRTERYQNPYITYYFLKEKQENLLFAGTQQEYEKFVNQWGVNMPRLLVNNFLELLQAIASAKAIICNQSFNFHLADAIKKRRILELSTAFPNTFPTGANGFGFYHQETLEYYVNQTI